MKKVFVWGLLIALIVGLLSGCGAEQGVRTNHANSIVTGEDESKELTKEEKEAKKDFATSSAKNDTDTGLRNIKIDTAEAKLSAEQKMIIEYFDEDYLTVPEYEFLRRYPNVYSEAQLRLGGTVKKVLSATNEEYKLVLWVGKGEELFFYRSMNTQEDYDRYLEKNAGNLVVISGTPSDAWFIEGDYLEVFGRYKGIETIEIDGVSYTVPCVSAHKAFVSNELVGIEKFNLKYIKTIASTIFGADIEVRNPVANVDYDEDTGWRVFDEKPFYIVELENQSNAKFTKYRFYTKNGLIEDAKTASDFWLLGTDENIKRTIEFSADFKHFFLFTYDMALENLVLEYYDSNLNKVWKREFEETTSAVYDYTKNNIYLVANNELYIINIETGEDTFAPAFIGEKKDIRKLGDGILTVGEGKSDAIIKNDLNGKMVWKTNLTSDVYSVYGIQLVGENIILQLDLGDGIHYIMLDGETGTIITDAVSFT